MNIKIYIIFSLLFFATYDLLSMDSALIPANQAPSPEDKMISLGQQFEDLRKQKNVEGSYLLLAQEIRKQNLTSAQFMCDLLRRRKKEVIQQIATDWKIRDEDIASLMTIHYEELNKRCKEGQPFHYSIEAPADQANYFREKVTSQSFKDLISNTLAIGRARKFIIRFGEFGKLNGVCAENLGFSTERELKYGPLSADMSLELSNTFFDLSTDKQEAILGHEGGHNILLHHFFNACLSNYLVDSMIIQHEKKEGVSFNNWKNRKENPELWAEFYKILEANYEDKAPLLEMVSSSDGFSKLARIHEVEPDLFLPLRDSSIAERFERVMLAKLETDNVLNLKTAEESHPSTEERILWISALRKLQQAEQLNSKYLGTFKGESS